MLLLIDAGNTRIKWALADEDSAPGAWLDSGAVAHADLPPLLTAWQRAPIARALAANVAGPAIRDQLAVLAQLAFFDPAAPHRLRNGYRAPSQLGADRFAAALGARALEPHGALVVATCGTATTIDAVSADDAFMGGMIAPGLQLMAGALAANTAQLPQVDSSTPPAARFADNTRDAIVSGCLAAQAGAIEHALAALPGARLLLSGGAARLIAPSLSVPHRLVDNIVLIGLHASTRGKPPC